MSSVRAAWIPALDFSRAVSRTPTDRVDRARTRSPASSQAREFVVPMSIQTAHRVSAVVVSAMPIRVARRLLIQVRGRRPGPRCPQGFVTSASVKSAHMRALCFDVYGVKRLAGSHEQAVAPGPAEANVGANLGQQNLADSLTVRRKDMYAVVTFAYPPGADPDIAV